MKTRLYFLDNYRAVLMLLGGILHIAIPYTTENFFPYFYESRIQHRYFDYVIIFLHSFLMPGFFLLVGFFANYLIKQYNIKTFIKERLFRIGLPLLPGMILYFPLHFWSFNRSIYPIVTGLVTTHPEYSLLTISKIVIATAWQSHLIATTFFNPESLWFLYYLLIFCLFNILFLKNYHFFSRNNRHPEQSEGSPHFSEDPSLALRMTWFFRFFHHKLWPIYFSLLLSLGCFIGKKAFLPTPNTLIPSLQLLFCYGLFYFLGWQAYQFPVIFKYTVKYLWHWLGIACLALIGYFTLLFGQTNVSPVFVFLCYGFLVTGMIIFLLGFFKRYVSKQNKLLSYFSKISYWCYLIRVPSLCVFQYVLITSALPLFFQLLFAFFGLMLISIISFEMVRWIIRACRLNYFFFPRLQG